MSYQENIYRPLVLPEHPRWPWGLFETLLALCQICGFTFVVLTAFIFGKMKSGLEWEKNNNFHGLLMSYGMVYFQGEALLSYRFYRNETKNASKMLHVFMHTFSFVLFIAGLIEIIEAKNYAHSPHFYSIHSWIGVTLMTVFIIQFFFGIITYSIPTFTPYTKRVLMPFHRGIGTVIFIVAVGQSVLGNVMYMTWESAINYQCYYTLSCSDHMDLLFNFNIIAQLLYGILVMLLVTREDWSRQKTPDEEE